MVRIRWYSLNDCCSYIIDVFDVSLKYFVNENSDLFLGAMFFVLFKSIPAYILHSDTFHFLSSSSLVAHICLFSIVRIQSLFRFPWCSRRLYSRVLFFLSAFPKITSPNSLLDWRYFVSSKSETSIIIFNCEMFYCVLVWPTNPSFLYGLGTGWGKQWASQFTHCQPFR